MASIENQNLNIRTEERLETPKELAARVGITARQVRHLIQTRQLEHVLIGCRIHIPAGAFARFLANSPGLNTAAAASAALARQTANKLKSSSRNFSSSATAEQARVIPMKSS